MKFAFSKKRVESSRGELENRHDIPLGTPPVAWARPISGVSEWRGATTKNEILAARYRYNPFF
jgi:hypothetical protein